MTVSLLDGTVSPPRYDIAANWITKRGDVVYMMSSRGPVAITDAGASAVGDDIAETLRETFGVGYKELSTFDGAAAGAAPAGPYVLWAYKTSSTHRTFAYNVERDAWTTWSARRPITAMCDGVNGTQMFGIAHYVGQYDDSRIAMGQTITATTQALTGDVGPDQPSATFVSLGSGRYSVTIGAGSAWTPTIGDVIVRAAVLGVVTAVTSLTAFEVIMNGVPANGTIAVWEGYPVRVIWTSRVLGQLAREKRYVSVSFAFALRQLLLKLTAYYQSAYAPAGVQTTSQPEIVPAWTAYDTTAAQTLLAAPEQIPTSVPRDVALDWGLRVGFTLQQARSWFSLGAVIVEVIEGSQNVGRTRA